MPSQASQPATVDDAKVPEDVLAKFRQVRPRLDETQRAIGRGDTAPGETSERLAQFEARQRTLRSIEEPLIRGITELDELQERMLGSEDILRIGFLAHGMGAARSVARLVVLGGAEHGTGFLVAPDVLATNRHVLPDLDRAHATDVEFEIHDASGALRETRSCKLDTGRFWFSDPELDVTLVALRNDAETLASTTGLGWHPLIAQQGKIRIGDPVNIIQHPNGRPKSIVLHNSNLLHLENATVLSPFLWYSSDTEKGSSGAPVFNNRWEVIGVHHRSVPKTNSKGELLDANDHVISRAEFETDPSRAVWIANQGIRTSRIVEALTAAPLSRDEHVSFRQALLARWEECKVRNHGQEATLGPLRSDPGFESATDGVIRTSGPVTIRITIEPGA